MVRRRSGPRVWTKGAAACFALLLGWAAARAGELVITSKDFAIEVGSRATLAVATVDGQPRGRLKFAIIGKRTVGKATLFREAVAFGQMRVRDSWLVKSEDEFAIYSSFGAPHPSWKCPLPLKKGLTYEYVSESGKVRARVEAQEEIEVPAGKFTCLVCVEEREADGKRWTQKSWVAPRIGGVKFTVRIDQDYTISLTETHEPRRVQAQPGTFVVSTFDTGNPLGSPLFPRAMWDGVAGQPGRASTVDIEPSGGAAGTPFSLRWTYHTKGTWVAASMLPSGNMGEPVDLSRYGSLSFYIKGLTERDCALSIQAKAAEGERRIFARVPVRVTTQWRKVAIVFETQPQLKAIDRSQVYILGFGDFDEAEAANVVWIDEVMLHLAKRMGEF